MAHTICLMVRVSQRKKIFEDLRSVHLRSWQTVHSFHQSCWLFPRGFRRRRKDVDLGLCNGPSVAILSIVSIAEC